MTDHERTGLPGGQAAGDLLGYPDRDADDEAQQFPGQEPGEEGTVGGGVPTSGGSATDPGPDAEADDSLRQNG